MVLSCVRGRHSDLLLMTMAGNSLIAIADKDEVLGAALEDLELRAESSSSAGGALAQDWGWLPV